MKIGARDISLIDQKELSNQTYCINSATVPVADSHLAPYRCTEYPLDACTSEKARDLVDSRSAALIVVAVVAVVAVVDVTVAFGSSCRRFPALRRAQLALD